MRSLIAFSALATVARAQSFSFAPSEVPSSIENFEPTATETISGPIETGQACAQVAGLVEESSLTFPSVQAELAYACLKSVPIDTEAASFTVASIKQMVEFQSTVTYLKDPPEGFPNEGVDLLKGLDDIGNKVSSGEYTNEYDFENDIAALFIKAHDGHLNFNGMAYAGVFRWRRNRQIALISASRDGTEAPKVWAVQDFNSTGAGFDPSPVSKIDDKAVTQFLEEESLLNAYHDPDTRYNAMFYMQPAENFGYFTNPRFYPGPKVSVTFENGTTNEYANSATVVDSNAWSDISDGQSLYETFITPTTSSRRKTKKRSPHRLPHHLENPREAELNRRYVPLSYPRASVKHSAEDVALAGFFINTGVGEVGVLMAQTFNTESNADAREFQSVVQTYIEEAKSRGVKRHVIDLRTNGGGKILLGYDTYKQFFPSQDPQLMSRYRGHQASAKFGESLSSFDEITNFNAELYTSPFNFHAYLNSEGESFSSWEDMYPPAKFNGDSFTNLLRYNLSDPYTTSSNRLSIGVTITGYAERSNFTEDPFAAEDIVILSDGVCASTCALFTELMVQQSKVRTIAIGGRPSSGPMQPVGGTKGSLVLQSDYLVALSSYVVSNFANSRSEATDMAKYLPNSFGISVQDASINFQDNIRKGLEKDGIPTQFLNDTASCRLWYQPNMYLNVTAVWSRVAEVAFGNDGKLDEDACVAGSVTSTEQQQGQGEGNPTSNGNGDTKPSGSKGAAPGLVRPAHEGWTALIVCGVVVLGSMGFGASLI